MTNTDFARPNQIVLLDQPRDKARLLRELAERAASALGIEAPGLTAALLRREDLGSTGLGGGIAIPHTRIAGIAKRFSVLAILRSPIAFDSIDGRPVDVVYLLVAPDTDDALKALAGISRALRDPVVLDRLRQARSTQMACDAFDA